MELNLKYYKGKDEYNDGDIENKIIDFIRKYPNDYEESFKEDNSWPVFYHLSSMRKNVINWYPFKENASILEVGAGMGAITEELCEKCKFVTSIELSKRRATAILERNKDANNLEIYVGNFEDIELNEKYDYILLNGVLEYGALYIKSDNPYEDFINKLKKNLKKEGKILIAIENRFGLKYWCGANEDHIGIPFDGINGYQQSKNIKTFNKKELEELAEKCSLNINFYYMFPDYKFPKVIYTDTSLTKDMFTFYNPYYCTNMNLVLNEKKVYKDVYESNNIPFFANSYFVELSKEKQNIGIEYVKFNNDFRKKQFNLCTYLKKDKFYKKALNEEAKEQIEKMKFIDNLLDKKKIKHASVVEKNKEIYCEKIKGENLNRILAKNYENKNAEGIFNVFDEVYKIIKQTTGKAIDFEKQNVFDKYNLTIPKEELNKMHFYEHGVIDIFPGNIIKSNNEYFLIDQEWYEENTPIEFSMYRAIHNFFDFYNDSDNLVKQLYEKYNINPKIFQKLEKKFLSNIRVEYFSTFEKYIANSHFIENINELENTKNILLEENDLLKKEISLIINEKNRLEKENQETDRMLNHTKKDLDSILNSKRYKFISKIADVKNKIKK